MSEIKKPLAAIDRALMFMHEHKAITLQGGLAIMRQAMTIRLETRDRARRYTMGDFKPLSVHYREKRFQVHVMMEYAELALDKIARALSLVLDYFSLGRIKFVNKYFADRKEVIERATTQEAYRKIVEKLGNPVQVSTVGSPLGQNTLILAGPGSGKTTVVVHRCAYLLQVERVPPRHILVLCFNHSAAVSLRKRLNAIVGKDARGVLVATYHSAAMRIAGVSLRDMAEANRDKEIDFGKVILDALSLIKGETEFPGVQQDEVRDQLLGGYSHILVDEYQDIDQAQYDFVSAIAGRTLDENDGRLSIMAVGDDDQNIYAFRGANVEFIRKFQEDYPAKVVYLVENYRSSKHIINASNQLIRHNVDRMKVDHPIRINRERDPNLPGGRWDLIDPVSKGRVQVINVKNRYHQAECVKAELERLKGLSPDLTWEGCAILARSRKDLAPVRSVLEQAGLPVKTLLESSLPLHRVREFSAFIEMLAERKTENRKASELLSRDLKGGNLLLRKSAAPSGKPGGTAHRQYEVLGLDDVYLDFAGGFHQRDPIHAHLSRIQAGDKVFLTAENPAINICDKEGVCVGRLSNSASDRWKEKLDRISEVRVVAMVERGRMDPQEAFRDRIKAEKWEVPVLEVVFALELETCTS